MCGRLNFLRSRWLAESSSQLNSLVGTWLGRPIFSCFWIFLSPHLFGPTNNAYLHILFKYRLLEGASHLYFIGKKRKIDEFINVLKEEGEEFINDSKSTHLRDNGIKWKGAVATENLNKHPTWNQGTKRLHSKYQKLELFVNVEPKLNKKVKQKRSLTSTQWWALVQYNKLVPWYRSQSHIEST